MDNKNYEKIKIKDLKIGMYVKLPSWLSHPFLKNEFIINNEKQISKIIASNISEVEVNIDKSVHLIDNIENISHGDVSDVKVMSTKKWEPEKLVSEEFKNIIKDKSIAKEKKSEAVYKTSIDMMDKLLQSPTTENIKAAKSGIADIVDYILSDRATSIYMLHITSHDFYTYTHSVNVGVLSTCVAQELYKGSDAHDMHELGAGFFLHDIGKTRISPEIINKPGRLSDDEMAKMRYHPYQGYKILEAANQLSEECKTIVMQHHEREDGTGYPLRLKGDEIHPYGRIGCISDIFDALTAERSYKSAMTPFDALNIMKGDMLHHFNKDIFTKFVLLFK
ncbi:MAG: HD-GYP domain-containing protein [Candidatus Magnetoovum sp. WYHC-5]|nr:HD-GYP domain-containing protein [Candidatus Magnetoovum sp. WYHC-5]